MVRFKPEKESRAKDWDFIFKAGLVFTLLISAALFIFNRFVKITDYPLVLLFALPVMWSIVGMIMAHKYSSAETRDMHRVSDYVVLSLCGYFAAFFLVLYSLKSKSIWSLAAAVLVYLLFYYSSWKSLRLFLEHKNIPLDWSLVWMMGVMLFIVAGISAWLMQSWSQLWGVVLLVAGVISVLGKFWGRLVRSFGYAERYKAFIYAGLAFNYFSLVLWTLVLVAVGMGFAI